MIMATPLAPPPRRRAGRPAVAPEPVSPTVTAVPSLDLSTVQIPDWLMPTLRDLMEVAERTFGRYTGRRKKIWVADAVAAAVVVRERTDCETPFPADPYRLILIDLLIEGVWGLHFRQSRTGATALSLALSEMKRAGDTLNRERAGHLPQL